MKITNKDPRFVGAWWAGIDFLYYECLTKRVFSVTVEGFLLLGIIIALTTLPLFCFPPQLRKKSNKRNEPAVLESSDAKMKGRIFFSSTSLNYILFFIFYPCTDALSALGRFVRNPVLVFQVLGGVFRIIGYMG